MKLALAFCLMAGLAGAQEFVTAKARLSDKISPGSPPVPHHQVANVKNPSSAGQHEMHGMCRMRSS